MHFLILIPIAFTVLQLTTRKYIFSPLITLSCAAIALFHSPVMAAALAVSAAGDWFMAHKGDREVPYILGIAGFFLGHVLFIAYTGPRILFAAAGMIAGTALAAFYLPYLLLRVIRKVPKLLKVPVVLYTLISLAGLACAVTTGHIAYILGIACLLFSDTMIAESDFVGSKPCGKWILPTYYFCHILVALSSLI